MCNQADHRLASGLSEHEVEMFVTAVIAMTEPVRIHFFGDRSFAMPEMKWCWKQR